MLVAIRSLLEKILGRRQSVSTQSDDRMSWQIAPDGRLLFKGRDHTPLYAMSMYDIERATSRMLRLIDQYNSSHPNDPRIRLVAIAIETHIATGLYQQGALTASHLDRSRTTPTCVVVQLEIAGEQRQVRIYDGMYYPDYQFIVENHPTHRVVRDTPDALDLMSGAKSF